MATALPFKQHGQIKRLGFVAWLALLPLLLALLLRPVSTNLTRAGTLAVLLALWVSSLLVFWKIKTIRVLCLITSLIACAFIILPGRNIDSMSLRRAYIDSLSRYEGTKYVWGGENKLGIDCSGLVRRGLIDADFKRGLLTVNPALMRAGGALWWHDCPAKGLLNQDCRQTREILSASSINNLEHSAILPGDIAVTSDGLHTLAYIGDKMWIEADPNLGGVVKVKVPAVDNYYFNTPVHLMRWNQFER
ncbi:MAG: NlpC/P60 family protein [Pyrinomonadaceae bacterium]